MLKNPKSKPTTTKAQSLATCADNVPLLGSHISIAGGPSKAIDRALSIGCTAIQIFVKSNMQWFSKPLDESELRDFHDHPRRNELKSIFGHTGYMINMGAVNPEFHDKSLRALSEELIRADQLSLPFLVLHPGAHMGAGEKAGLSKITTSLDRVLDGIPKVKTRIALETTAGQGTSLGCRFEHLAWILEHSNHPDRLCICLDTAHVFAAGYDISTDERTADVFEEFDKIIGIHQLAAIHCNDSKTKFNSRVDRHEHIGKGEIGTGAFRFIMRDNRFAMIPKVLETPKGPALLEDVENMKTLLSLASELITG